MRWHENCGMAAWEDWDKIAIHPDAQRSRPACEVQTGYCSETLSELWEGAATTFSLVQQKSNGRTPVRFEQRRKEIWRAQHYFYVLLVYIHRYPVEDEMPDVLVTTRLNTSIKGGVNVSFFYRTIMPLARIWSGRVNHIFWDDRLAFNNHHVNNFFLTFLFLCDESFLFLSAFLSKAAHNHLGYHLHPCPAIPGMGQCTINCERALRFPLFLGLDRHNFDR